MPITLAPLAAEHLPALGGLVTAAEFAAAAAQPDVFHYRAVLDRDRCVGMVGLNRAGDPQIVAATVPAEQRRGYATAAVVEMVRFAFEVLGLPEVYAVCQAGRPSNRVAEKAGFAFAVQRGNDRYYRLPRAEGQAARPAPAVG